MKCKYIIFDLDDTLIYEVDFLKSAYREIATILDSTNHHILYDEMYNGYLKGENVFEYLNLKYPEYDVIQLLGLYRNHKPNLIINDGALDLFTFCKQQKFKIGLITDGRSITQRNKLKALGVEEMFDKILISEEFGSTKPDERNYTAFLEDSINEYLYIADNPKKDFVTPNRLGWNTICLLDKGKNIHTQDFSFPDEYLAKKNITSLQEVIYILQNNSFN